tara:strand:+ start:8465 stop:8959 length:495 start_codon:yes stop_codon:yes gene_type:complete
MQSDLVAVGQIFSIFGIKGQVKVRPLSDVTSRFTAGNKVILNNQEVLIQKVSKQKWYYILLLENYNTPDKAKTLKDKFIYIKPSQIPHQQNDTYYYYELIGLSVINVNQSYLGKISNIITTGANDVYVITNEDNEEILIPAIKSVILDVDIKSQKMTVDQPSWL